MLGINQEIFIRNNPIISLEITRTIRADESPIGNFVVIFASIRKNHIKKQNYSKEVHKTSALFFKNCVYN
jgi:hypothetical protein